MEEQKPLNLYQKLVQVRKCVEYIQKNAQGFNFQYATESQILGAIRGKMDELNVFLEMDVVSLEPVKCTVMVGQKDNKQPKDIEGVKGVYKFTWTNADDPTEQIHKTMMVQDSESDIVTVGGLMTYANRYFLYKFFCVATDKDDPDKFENRQKKLQKTEPAADKPVSTETLTLNQVREITNLIGDDTELMANVLKVHHVDQIANILANDYAYLFSNLKALRKS